MLNMDTDGAMEVAVAIGLITTLFMLVSALLQIWLCVLVFAFLVGAIGGWAMFYGVMRHG